MSLNTDSTTLICLFHHNDQAQAALRDLETSGIPRSSITTIGGDGNGNAGYSASTPTTAGLSTAGLDTTGLESSNVGTTSYATPGYVATETDTRDYSASATGDSAMLETLGVPSRDLNHLRRGLQDGGVIIAVFATGAQVARVESIFDDHKATKIDETGEDSAGAPLKAATVGAGAALGAAGLGTSLEGDASIPVVEEELQVGKRTVDQGGVRVYKRIVEIPAEQTVSLREEHVVVERNAVDRPATAADLEGQGNRSIELIETAEEAVVGKTARVVEEVVVGKEAGVRTETIRDTVRKTEVEVENLPSVDTTTATKKSY